MADELAVALVLVLANAFFVAVEFSVARLRPTQAQELRRQRRSGARSVSHAIDHIDAYLSACQLGITMASLGLGALGEPAFHDLLEPLLGDAATIGGFGLAAGVAFLMITTLHVVVGELAPKSAAIARTGPVVLALAPPMRAFYLSTKPLVDLLNGMGNLLLKPFGVPPASETGHQPHTEGELRELLRESSREGMIEREQQELSEAALVFGDTRAREVMKPRREIDLVLTTDSPRTVADRAVTTGRTRLPLCERDGALESAVGAVNAKDLLPLIFDDTQDLDVSNLARPLGHVSESAHVDEVLRHMREQRLQLALVHDEHDTVVGLVTIEDILEELVGEIEDEFDHDEAKPIEEREGRLVVVGEAPMRALAARLGLPLEGHHETTVGGYLLEELGRVPRVGEVIDYRGHRFEIVTVEQTRITRVAVPEAEAKPGTPLS
jgi:CBS domain containing-hemolysin-like protein